jgi:hypothetical protein
MPETPTPGQSEPQDKGRRSNAALDDVLAAAEYCRTWFEDNQIPYDAPSLVTMTRLVLERDAELHRRSQTH